MGPSLVNQHEFEVVVIMFQKRRLRRQVLSHEVKRFSRSDVVLDPIHFLRQAHQVALQIVEISYNKDQ